jgi:hypothetical protein
LNNSALKISENLSSLRASIKEISNPNSFIATNFNSLNSGFVLGQSTQVEFIKQLIRTGGVEKFTSLVSASQGAADAAAFDAAFEKLYEQSINQWYVNSAAPGFITSLMGQDSNTLLTQIINYEMLRTLTSSTDPEAKIALMDSSVQRVLRDMLATDAGMQKLGELVMATKNMSDELARQSAFESVYGTSFNQWVETKAITWVKEALGIPRY